MSDLVERVTRALDTWMDPEKVRDAIAVVLEEAAKVCDEREHANLHGVKECAAAIRSLKEKP